MALAIPTVHSNGTSGKELLAQLLLAYRAVKEAERLLAAACPHNRDYYVQFGNPGKEAREQHASRMYRLHSVAVELETIAIAIQDQF